VAGAKPESFWFSPGFRGDQVVFESFIANQEKLEGIIGRELDPIYFKCLPCGSKLHVVVEEVPKKFGMIATTEQYQQSAQRSMGVGYIMAAGPLAGKEQPGPVQGVLCNEPADLLYLHVIFGGNVGVPISISVRNSEFDSEVLAVDCKNILSVVDDPTTLQVRAERGD